ncbi:MULTISPECIES: pPIWI_RE module domain-containing protein [Streptomyces]|uniref:DUF3893 domain-containing protein n=1 Tax=Streptomyces tsukubensis (strain DSM 42081 / NBRC 108919 / NRRL 18488 / 9993) TaxID=1114943 RepID=I2N666_STRT9|nr:MULTISPECIES: DUF3962 domain-containing protein [Streptomyces]AZK96490.1 hypothetical protein B7R87_23435 [Streptomyces tsukubensis]EIF92513.1 hypothetical protein [Streptomyces tsukubensis NRRL18488]MYS64752.1 DUF3962 domain-containing protein [Streptomyces sp. SID5473]QKM67506.1 DUF3893 domain-containing protein [Streptomyces tsukubensis NRRL18488]TAI43901.1 DUF3893 domain-containing protein [Streptomyces tsukubensis]
MGIPYARIARSAARPAPGAEPLTIGYRAMERPELWNTALLELVNHGRDPEAAPWRTVPTRRLDRALTTLCPELCTLPRPTGTEPGGPAHDYWFLVPRDIPDPLPPEALEGMLNLWVGTLPRVSAPQQVAEALGALRSAPPVWRETELDLFGCPTSEGGTALPRPYQYRLAMDWLARRIEQLPPYDSGGELLSFHAVPRGPADRGAELMSQALRHEAGGKVWWWSVVIRLSLHSVPFDPLPRVHFSFGVRRWATHPSRTTGRLYLPPGRRTSVYLRCPVPWLPGAPLTGRYTVARLEWARDRGSHVWHENDPAGLLRPLAANQSLPLPSPEELLTEPAARLGEGPGVRAAVVHSAAMGTHAVERGFMSHQRSQLFAWVREALPAHLAPVPDLGRSTVGEHQPHNRPSRQQADETERARTAEERRIALASAMCFLAEEGYGDHPVDTSRPVLTLRLVWTTHRMRREAIAALARVLGLKGDGGDPEHAAGAAPGSGADTEMEAEAAYDNAAPGNPVVLEWQTPELTVHLRCLPSAGLGDGLTVGTGRTVRESFVKGVMERRRTVAQWLSADGALPDRPALAVVEIDQGVFATELADPKYAVRLGCADAGVVSQFVLVPRRGRQNGKTYNTERNASHRAQMSWLDGFRQLGVRVLPEHSLGGLLPDDLRYAAVWAVKRRSDGPTRTALRHPLPVALLMTPEGNAGGRARIHGWDLEQADWVPYPAMLVRLTRSTGLERLKEFAADLTAADPDSGAETEPEEDPVADARAEDGDSGEAPRKTDGDLRGVRLRDEQRRAMEGFLQHVLPTLRTAPTALFVHAQNLRSLWTWIQDGQVGRDLLRSGQAPAAGLDPDLRLVRVRDGGGDAHETPGWWGTGHPGGVNGLSAGLWGPDPATGAGNGNDPRVFYSTTEKALQFGQSAVRADKLAPRPVTQGRRKGELVLDTEVPAWNPHLAEITVLGCHREDGDEPAAYALLAHQLRQAADYPDALAKPLPLHLAEKAEEYVLPLPPRAEAADTL